MFDKEFYNALLNIWFENFYVFWFLVLYLILCFTFNWEYSVWIFLLGAFLIYTWENLKKYKKTKE